MTTTPLRGGKKEPSEPLRVLVIEDEFLVASTLQLHLEALGCEVVGIARRADAGVEMAYEMRPDLVLVDIGLPDQDGVQVTKEIMEHAPTAVVVVTAYEDHRVEQARAAGAVEVLTKPVVEEQLAQVLRELGGGGS